MTERPTYPYPDETGRIVAKKVRVDAHVRPWYAAVAWDENGRVTEWAKGQPEDWSLGLWPADKLAQETTTEPDGSLPVYLTEGESDALALRKLGDVCAYSVPNGSSQWLDEWADPLTRPSVARVFVLADRDDHEGGQRHAARVVTALKRRLTVPVALLLPAEGFKDAREHLEAGQSVADFAEASAADLAGWMSAGLADAPVAGSSKKKAKTNVPLPDEVSRWVDRAVKKAKDEGRNNAGLWLAVQLRDAGLSRKQATAVLVSQYAPEVNGKRWGRDPYRDAEAREAVKQAFGRAPRDPAAAPDESEDDVLRLVRAEFLVNPETQPDHLADLLTDEDIAALPPVEWVIDGWVPRGGYTVVYGPPGVGKTLALLGMTRAVRRGTRWQNWSTRKGATVYYQGEGLAQFRERIAAWDAAYPLRADQSMSNGGHLERVVDLTKPEGVAAVIRTVRGFEGSTGERVGLLVIDPLVEYMTGEENGPGMELASRGLRALAKLLDVGVVVGHHSNASGERERGAAFLRMRAGAVVRMETTDEPEAIGLVQQKQRNAEPRAMVVSMVAAGTSVVLEYQHGASGLDVTTYAAAQGKRRSEAKIAAKADNDRADQEKVINALREATKPLSFNALMRATALNNRRLHSVVDGLTAARIVSETEGRNNSVLHELAEEWRSGEAKWDV